MEKIRVCFTSPTYSSYSETFIHNLKKGIDGDVFHCFGGNFPLESEDNELQNYLKPKLLHRILKKLGLLHNSFAHFYFRNYLMKKKIDVVFANYGPSGAEILPVIVDTCIPFIVHFHGFDASVKDIIEKYRQRYIEMFSVATAIIVVSEVMKRDLIELGAPENKLLKITYAPNPKFLAIIPDYNSSQLLSIGRFVEKKAPYLTLLAYKVAKESCPGLSFKFVGTGPLLSVCKDLCQYLNIKDVEFAGVLTPEDIRKEMLNSFCFVLHSKQAENGDKEGTPVAILEAMAAGLPVLSTRNAGIPDVVIEGENGFLVGEGEIGEMAKRMIQLYREKHLAEKLGINGKFTISRNFNTSEYFKSINELIHNCVHG